MRNVHTLMLLPFAFAAAAIVCLAMREMTSSAGVARRSAATRLLTQPPLLGRDPSALDRRTSGVQVVGALVLGLTGAVLVVVGLLAQDVWAGTAPPAWLPAEAESAALMQASPATAKPDPALAVATPAAARAATPAAPQTDAGSPIDGRALVEHWTKRGVSVAPSDDAVACPNARTTPRAYRFTRGGGVEQKATVLAYPSVTALTADWAVERGSPLAYRGGICGAGRVIYWNQNVVLIIPETADATTRQILVDVFLTAHNTSATP